MVSAVVGVAVLLAASGLLSVIDRLTPADTGSFHDVRGQAVEW